MSDYDGTVTSKLKPVVTTLTEALLAELAPEYRKIGDNLYERLDEHDLPVVVTGDQLWKDVQRWLMDLEKDMQEESDRQYAKMVVSMIRKNKGWVSLLTNRVKKHLE